MRAERSGPRYLLVVERSDRGRDFYNYFMREFSESEVEIIVDRRQGDRRQGDQSHAPERRQGDRRRQPALDAELRTYGFVLVRQQ